MNEHFRVAVVGGGPSGLTAAAALASELDGDVIVIEREHETGGIPRHSNHLGYGMRDLHRFISGPAYARRLTDLAKDVGARLETSAMVTGWAGDRSLEITSPSGRRVVEADAVVLATGARERPRSARHIPGDRPDGVMTTGQLQNMVHLHHTSVGRRAVVVGGELVSWSAVLTLREAGCTVALMTTEHSRPEAYAAFRILGRLSLRVPVATRTRIVRINGRTRVESVEIEEIETGARRIIACDTVIMTGDWIPDHELARAAGLTIDRHTLGPQVDTSLATSRPGVFAVGNLLHPVDTADVAALDGRHVTPHVLAHLAEPTEAPAGYAVSVEAPLRWVVPQLVRPGGPAPARGDLLLWSDVHRNRPTVLALQDGRQIGRVRTVWPAAPGRVFRVPASILDGAAPTGDVRLSLSA